MIDKIKEIILYNDKKNKEMSNIINLKKNIKLDLRKIIKSY